MAFSYALFTLNHVYFIPMYRIYKGFWYSGVHIASRGYTNMDMNLKITLNNDNAIRFKIEKLPKMANFKGLVISYFLTLNSVE